MNKPSSQAKPQIFSRPGTGAVEPPRALVPPDGGLVVPAPTGAGGEPVEPCHPRTPVRHKTSVLQERVLYPQVKIAL